MATVNDAHGLPLALGDTVYLPLTVTSLTQSVSGNAVSLRSVATSSGSGTVFPITGLDPSMVIRANPGDPTTITPVSKGASVVI